VEGLNENELPPDVFEANVDIFFFTSPLPHEGHITESTLLALKTSFSNDLLHSLHINS
jgi:hypothetical protein